MIGIKLVGGLGNQMFQYAFGRALSEQKKQPLMLDTAWYYNIPAADTPRTFDLNCFPLKADVFRSDQESPFSFHKIKFLEKVMKKLSERRMLPLKDYFAERMPSFDESVFETQGKMYFDGYWQSPQYFEKIRDLLIEEFTPKDLTSFDKEMMTKVKNTSSVSVHIRRGDYVSNDYARARHLVCDRDYYDKALSSLNEKYSNLKYFFFSDDPEWVKSEFYDLDIEVIEGNQDRPWIDLYLMSGCRHHIIANSSFSWWGAWLSTEEGETIAPRIWFTNGDPMDDLIPENWVRL